MVALDFALLALQRVDFRGQLEAFLLLLRRQARINAVGTVDCGENSMEPVIILHPHRVELVVVALRALHCGALEDVEDGRDHLIAVEVFRNAPVELAFADLDVTDEVPRSRREEAEGDDAIGRARKEHVTGHLLPDKTTIGFVFVKAADDVVAIGPGVVAGFVLVVAVGLAIAREIEPVLAEFFAEGGRGEECVDESGPVGLGNR